MSHIEFIFRYRLKKTIAGRMIIDVKSRQKRNAFFLSQIKFDGTGFREINALDEKEAEGERDISIIQVADVSLPQKKKKRNF